MYIYMYTQGLSPSLLSLARQNHMQTSNLTQRRARGRKRTLRKAWDLTVSVS